MSEAKRKKKKAREIKKPPPRWRKYLVQAELELPPAPPGSSASPGSAPGDSMASVASDLPSGWRSAAVTGALVGCCLVLLVITSVSLYRTHEARAEVAAARASVSELTLRASTSERELHIAPNPRSWSATPDAVLAAPDPPEMLEVYFPIGYADYPTFAVTIEKVDHGRVLTVQRMVPDSNRDLRLALNSSAFGPGEYRFRLQGYTWRGDRVDVGWVRLSVK